ncbi:phage antirepressor KilAC domain-containing protein, partial [Streptococcus danieliae]|nr:phage antirepressor KilAC domain-containing protein [Streptococcus danieliae]
TYKEALISLVNQIEENEKLQLTVAVQNQQLQELQPKATYYDMILQSKSLVSITKIAKDFGLSGTKLNKILKEQGVQFKQGNVWLLYRNYADKGYTQSKTSDLDGGRKSVLHTYWTQKGRLFIYELLKGLGIKPTVERET